MAIAIRSGAPATYTSTTATVGGTLTGSQQPQSGDVLIIIHANDFYADTAMPTPTVGGSTSGVTAISGGSIASGSSQGNIKSYYYVVGSTGDLAVSVTETGAADEEKCLIVYVLSGADTSTVIDGTAATQNNSTSSTSHIAPSISPADSDSYLICHVNTMGGSGGGTYSPPGGMTESADFLIAGITSVGNAIQQLAASGATGSKTFTITGSASYQSLALAVLTAGGGTTADPAGIVAYPITPGLISPTGFLMQPEWNYDSAVTVNGTAEGTTHDFVTGDPLESIAITDGTAPAITQTAQDATPGVGYTAGAPSISHTTGDALGGVGATDGTAPALTHTTGDITAKVDINGTDAATTHTTYDATVSTASLLNVNAPATDNQHITADATTKIDEPAGAPATTHQTLDTTGSVGVADGTAPTNTHTTSAATASVGAQPTSVAHDITTLDVTSTQTTNAEAPSIAHNAFNAIASTTTAPPAFVSVEAGSTAATLDNATTRAATTDGRTSVSGLIG